MMPLRVVILLLLGLALALQAAAQYPDSIPNPVLDGVADAGVLNYNGEYYIMGVGTDGDVYVSADLVHWRGPEHAFSMDNAWTHRHSGTDRNIHACDFEYLNGTFHLYWSVNYWGEPEMTVHIGHATAEAPAGPYEEPVKVTWFDDRIDAHLFVDDDGASYFYSVKFTDGNVIYGQRMADPWTLVEEPVFLLSALPNTWETLAHRVNEGAEVDKYRGRYYMLYASNTVSARWGQYAVGVAEADHPLGFHNGSKYAHPVMEATNEARLTADADVLVPLGEGTWRYTTSEPAGDWAKMGYDDAQWGEGPAAFGHEVPEGPSTSNRTRTLWQTPELWLRRSFHLDEQPSEYVQLLMRLRGAADVYVNGERVYRSEGVRSYATLDLDDVSAFRPGENVVAVHARQDRGDRRYVDLALLDPRAHPGEAYTFSPGQPNLVRGPNGFAWWMVYFARFDAGGKDQAVDRVHFFDRELYVDGPTSTRTPGYHPPPSPPTVGDLFDEDSDDDLGTRWQTEEGRWRVREGEAVQLDDAGARRAILSGPASANYLFQAGVRLLDDAASEAGIVAYRDGTGDELVVSVSRADSAWTYRLTQDGSLTERAFPLPEDFAYDAYHSLRIEKNGGRFTVAVDGRPAPDSSVIDTELTGTGLPGLYTRDARTAFDGVVYTRGWDEYGDGVTRWASTSDTWHVDAEGLHQTSVRGEHVALKGDPLAAYEFSAQLYGELEPEPTGSASRRVGAYAVYVDAENWLRAEVDMDRHRLIVERWRDGAEDGRWEVGLPAMRRLYPDAARSDPFAKRFTFRTPTRVGALEWQGEEPLPEDWTLAYRRDGLWVELPSLTEFEPLVTESLRLEMGRRVRVDDLYARILGKSTYNLRAVKLPDEVILFVDGHEVLRVPGRWPAARVGLSTTGTTARFDGLTLFDLPPHDE